MLRPLTWATAEGARARPPHPCANARALASESDARIKERDGVRAEVAKAAATARVRPHACGRAMSAATPSSFGVERSP